MPYISESGIAQHSVQHPYAHDGHLLRLSFSEYVPVITPTTSHDYGYWGIYHYASGGQAYYPENGYEAYGHKYDPIGVHSLQSGDKYYLYCSANNARAIVNNQQVSWRLQPSNNSTVGFGLSPDSNNVGTVTVNYTATLLENGMRTTSSFSTLTASVSHMYPVTADFQVSGNAKAMWLIEADKPFQLWNRRIDWYGREMDAYYWYGLRCFEE